MVCFLAIAYCLTSLLLLALLMSLAVFLWFSALLLLSWLLLWQLLLHGVDSCVVLCCVSLPCCCMVVSLSCVSNIGVERYKLIVVALLVLNICMQIYGC